MDLEKQVERLREAVVHDSSTLASLSQERAILWRLKQLHCRLVANENVLEHFVQLTVLVTMTMFDWSNTTRYQRYLQMAHDITKTIFPGRRPN